MSLPKAHGLVQLSFVRKKDGTMRFCVDYRRLNNVTIKDLYPLPNIEDTFDTLSGANYFCAPDLASGYWQVDVDPQDRHKTAFSSRSCLLVYAMPQPPLNVSWK